MGLEVTIPLKIGTLEIEFDDVAELERRLARLDVARIERAVLVALHNGDGTTEKQEKKAKKGKRGSKKKGSKAKKKSD